MRSEKRERSQYGWGKEKLQGSSQGRAQRVSVYRVNRILKAAIKSLGYLRHRVHELRQADSLINEVS